MKKVLIIKTSPRKDGNSDMLADSFAKGAIESGNEVEVVSVVGQNIEFCRGCMTCAKTGKCVINDFASTVCAKAYESDVVVFATPVYYYSVSGQMKTIIDRLNPLYDSDYKIKEAYLLATAAEDEDTTVSGTVTAMMGWVDCLERVEFKGYVFAGGVSDKGDIKGHKALVEAYNKGKSV